MSATASAANNAGESRRHAATFAGTVHEVHRQPCSKETTMKWETPQAVDLRFGFEITMYIATR